MPRYQDKDFSFQSPADWVDRTIIAHAAPTDARNDSAPNFVTTREAIRQGDSLRMHADRQLLELGRHLKDFDLLESRETTCGGSPAVFLRYTWMGHFGKLEQTVTMVERPNAERGRVAMSLTTTAKADEATKTRALFDEILKSVRFEGGPPDGGAPPPAPPRQSGGGYQDPTAVPLVPMPGSPRGGRR